MIKDDNLIKNFSINGWNIEFRIVHCNSTYRSRSFCFDYPDKQKILSVISLSLSSYDNNAYVDNVRIIPDIEPLDVTRHVLKK